MDTQNIAEKVIEGLVKPSKPVNMESGDNKPFKFVSQFGHGKRRKVNMNYHNNITDDSGFIPFEKEIERFVNSGEQYQKYMRMAFPNGSADKVINDYAEDFGAMSRLDAINFVHSRSDSLRQKINIQTQNNIKDKILSKMNSAISVNKVNLDELTSQPKAEK